MKKTYRASTLFVSCLCLVLFLSQCRYEGITEIHQQAIDARRDVDNGLCFLDGGVDILAIRATSYQTPVYCRLSNLATLSAEQAKTEHWDIGGLRFVLYTNSGTSALAGNPGGNGGACLSNNDDYSSVSINDCTTFSVDNESTMIGAGGISITTLGNPVLANWYDYDISQHVLRAKSANYLLRSGENDSIIYKITFLDYYSSVGTPGYIRFRFQRL